MLLLVGPCIGTHKPILFCLHPHPIRKQLVATMGRLNKRKQQLKRLAEARQASRNKDESGREKEEEVIVFDGETIVDVDVDVLGEDVVW